MGFFDKVKRGLRKLDSYLDKAEEIVEKALPAVTAISHAYAGYVTLALKVIQFVEDLTPELDEANEEEFRGTDKLDLASELLAAAAEFVPNGDNLSIGKAKPIVQAVYDVARSL